jgi:Carboxypeptidase regulatory-like domain
VRGKNLVDASGPAGGGLLIPEGRRVRGKNLVDASGPAGGGLLIPQRRRVRSKNLVHAGLLAAAVTLWGLAAPPAAAAPPLVSIKAHTDLHLGAIRKDYDGNYVVTGQLVDRLTGAGIGGYHVTVTLGGHVASAVTGTGGSFEAPVPSPGGHQDVKVEFAGGRSLDPAAAELHDVDVDKVAIDLHLAVAPTGQGAEVTVTATAGGTRVNVPVDIFAGAPDVDPAHVGKATAGGPPFQLRRAAAGGAGRRRVRATFAGDDVYAPATAEATVELTTATTTTLTVDSTHVAYEDDVDASGRVTDDDGHGVPRVTVALLAGDRHIAAAQTDADGRFHTRFEAQVLGTGRSWALQAVVETTTGWLRPSRSPPVTIAVDAPHPVPIAYTVLAFLGTALAAAGFWAARTRPWTRWIQRPADTTDPAKPTRAEPASGLVLSRPGLVSTLRRPHDRGFTGAVRDAARGRAIAGARLELVRGGETRTAVTDTAGAFAFEDLADGEWRVAVVAPGHVTERFAATVPHRGELRNARVDLVAVREKVFTLYRRAALPLLPKAELWGVWSPRQVVDHVRDRRPTPALADLTDFVEEAYFSARSPEEAILPEAEARVEAAVREQSGV